MTINLKNLKANYLKIKEYVNKDIIAVLKDNAYSSNLVDVSRTLSNLNVKMIALATLEEAIILRKNLIFTPILLFERIKNFRLLAAYHITSSIQSLNHLKELANSNYPLMVHLEIESGFNRFGINEDEIDIAIDIINKSRLILKGIYIHYQDEDTLNKQNEIFKRIINKFSNYKNLIIHSQSSSYIHHNFNFVNAIRIGLSLYGINDYLELNPVINLYAYVLRCKKINKGEYVSYNKSYKAPNDGYCLTLGIGYGDGWHRDYNTVAYYNDEYYSQIGVTNMDALMLFSKTPIKEEELFELCGNNITYKDIQKLYNVSYHDFFASLRKRIERKCI